MHQIYGPPPPQQLHIEADGPIGPNYCGSHYYQCTAEPPELKKAHFVSKAAVTRCCVEIPVCISTRRVIGGLSLPGLFSHCGSRQLLALISAGSSRGLMGPLLILQLVENIDPPSLLCRQDEIFCWIFWEYPQKELQGIKMWKRGTFNRIYDETWASQLLSSDHKCIKRWIKGADGLGRKSTAACSTSLSKATWTNTDLVTTLIKQTQLPCRN